MGLKYSDQTMQAKLVTLAEQHGHPADKVNEFMYRVDSDDLVPGICMDCSEGMLVEADCRTGGCSGCGGDNVWSAIELYLCSNFE